MEKYRTHSRHVIHTPFEAEIGDPLRERIVGVLMNPLMAIGVALYVLTMWFIERTDEAVR
jgi:hypothetical protein